MIFTRNKKQIRFGEFAKEAEKGGICRVSNLNVISGILSRCIFQKKKKETRKIILLRIANAHQMPEPSIAARFLLAKPISDS